MRQGRMNASPTYRATVGAALMPPWAGVNRLKPGTHECVPYVQSNRRGGIYAALGRVNRLKSGAHKCARDA